MIVTTLEDTAQCLRAGRPVMTTRSLARRGFFYSETESVDHLELAPGTELGSRGRSGTQELWFVTGGSGELHAPARPARPLRQCDLIVCPLDSGTRFRAGPDGLRLVLVAVHPPERTARLPVRRPETA
jgi:quercetin dioxygenase-like cupin family protein